MSEYAGFAARLRAALANLHCRFTGSVVYTEPDGVERSPFRGEYFAKGESRQTICNYPSENVRFAGQTDVTSLSQAQAFLLRRPSPDAPYAVESFDDSGDTNKRQRTENQVFFRVNAVLESLLRTYDLSVETLLERGVIESCRSVERGPKTYLEVLLRFEPGTFYKSCKVVLDPEMEYAVHEYECEEWPSPNSQTGTTYKRRGIIECQSTREGYIVPKHVHVEGLSTKASGEQFKEVREYEIEVVSVGGVSDSQFTLAAFGVPNVTLKQRLRLYPFDRWYFWLLIGIGMAGWLYLRMKRRGQRADQVLGVG